MPRGKNWRKGLLKKGNVFRRQKILTDFTEDPCLTNQRTRDLDLTEDTGLCNSTGDSEDPVLPKNRTNDIYINLETYARKHQTRKNCINIKQITDHNIERTAADVKKKTIEETVYSRTQETNACEAPSTSYSYTHCASYAVPDFNSKSTNYVEVNDNYSYKSYSKHNGLGMTYGLPFSASTLKLGTFHQNDQRFGEESRGNQCTCNALSFVLFCFLNKAHISLVNLDEILITGDQIYTKVLHDLQSKGQFHSMLFNLEEIPELLHTKYGSFKVQKHAIISGIAVDFNGMHQAQTLQKALSEALTKCSALLILIGAICSGLQLEDNTFYFFDSHSHNKNALSSPEGASIMIGFSTIDDLVNYLYAFYQSMHIDLQNQFDILPVSISRSVDKSNTDQMSKYFLDQALKNASHYKHSHPKSRTAYMKLYMQNKRRNEKFKLNEKAKYFNARNFRRQNPVSKAKERDYKRLVRQNPEVKKQERDKKRIVGENPEVKRQQRDKKRIIRENPEVKRQERDKKRIVRENLEVRRQERDKKRIIRENPEVKRQERDKKRIVRKNLEVRRQERDKKRIGRENLEVKRQERDKKRIVRENLEVRREERDKKRIVRENPDVKKEERDKKRVVRENPEVKRQERDKKRILRENPEVKRQERDKKRLVRENPLSLEKERLIKHLSRQKNFVKTRHYNRSVQKNKRKFTEQVQRERDLKKGKLQGSNLEQCIKQFEKKISIGPIYVCTCCHQTWFCDSVVDAKHLYTTLRNGFQQHLTHYKSVDNKEWICHTCINALKQTKIPRLSKANKMGFPDKPKELELFPLEERLISLRIPFMQIRELPRGGQLSVKGNVVNVPVDIQPTIQSLPRNIDQSGTIAVKLKKKLNYKSCDYSENVRPLAVLCALHYLVNNSDLYKSAGIKIEENWGEKIPPDDLVENSTDETNAGDNEDSDHFSEIDGTENRVGNTDTLLDEIPDEADINQDTQYIFAPGQGQKPVGLYNDPDSEYLSFPTIFCGQKRPDNKDRSVNVQYTDIVKWELRSVDRRVAQSVPNIFYKLKKIQIKNITDKVNLALRRCKSEGKRWTAKDVLDPSTVNDMVKLDEGYFILRSLRNSPAYLEKRKKDVFAMIRQLGLPTWFGSFSSADTMWADLIKILGKLNDGKDYTYEEIEAFDWQKKTGLVQKDPVTCSRYFDHRIQQFIKNVLKSNHHPIGEITDYFYRVEFQQRGSPHIHILIWVANAPKYKKDSNEDVISCINKNVSCSKSNEFKKLINLQLHKHSRTCRKKGHPVCRFGFPLPPFQKTVILEPLDFEVEKYKSLYREVQKKINDLHDSENIETMTFHEFLNDVIEMTEDEYIKVVRSNLNGPKVFLERKPSEVRVNPYMKVVLSAWKANHDLQFVLDPYACAMYIVSYINKSQKGMSALLDQATKEARQGNMDLKRQVRHIGNYFTNSVETSAQEAVYLTLQIPLTKATRQVVFINTSLPDERTFLLKQRSTLEKMSPDSIDIEAESDIKRYSKRPSALENWCLADYVSQLDIRYPKSKSKDSADSSSDVDEEQCEDVKSDCECDFGNRRKINFTLKNGTTIRQRKTFRVIRYVRFNKTTNTENFYRERLLLFNPWRNELTGLKGCHETYEAMYKTVQRFVEKKASEYEHNAEELQRAQEQAEHDYRHYDEIAPGTQQTELEDIEEGSSDCLLYVPFNPERPAEHTIFDLANDFGIAQNVAQLASHEKRMNDSEYHRIVRSLNVKQSEFFYHVLQWIKTREEPLYLFLTGGAGVGKSVVVRALYQALHRYLCKEAGDDPDDVRILLCAPTGKAAYNINGVTLHNAFYIQPSKGFNQSFPVDVRNTFQMKYRNLSIVIIDEISMVGKRMFSFLDTRLKKIKGNNNSFGGVSILAVGDLLQLKPVFDDWIFNDLDKGITALAPNLWRDLFSVHNLTEIMRQKEDLKFAQLLNRLRENKMTEDDYKMLETRKINDNCNNCSVPHLFVDNSMTDCFNLQCIAQLDTQKVNVTAFDTVQADVSECIKAKLLKSIPNKQSETANLAKVVQLAVGMKYDITANIDVEDGLTNGSSCEIKFIDFRKKERPTPSIVWVMFSDEKIGINARKKYRQWYNSEISNSWTPIFDVKRTFQYRNKTYERTQFPLRPAAAKTIHKAQGDTLDEVVVSLDSRCKSKIPHIHYVALSRVRSLKGLHILDLNKDKITVAESVILEMNRLTNEAPLKLCYIPLYSVSDNFLKVVFHNARSLHAHFEDVKADHTIKNADLIGIAETRLVATDKDELYEIEGFTLLRNDQKSDKSTRPPHGLAVYVRKNALFEQIKFSTPLLELIIIDILCKGHMQVVFVYKAPACTMQDFKEVFMTVVLPTLKIQHSNILIIGDFNTGEQYSMQNLILFMENMFHSKQLITKNTTDYGTKLDLAFLKAYIDYKENVKTDVLEAYWSDHKIIYTAVDL